MAQAIVQNSCRKLRSAIGDEATMRLNFTIDLQEMLKQLVAIHAMILIAEDRWKVNDWDKGQKLLTKVEAAAYMVCHMVEQMQEMTVPAGGVKTMLAHPENVILEPSSKEEMLGKMKKIKEKLEKLRKKLHKELREESVQIVDVAEKRAMLQAPEATEGREEDVAKIVARLSACHSREGPIILLIHGECGIGKATVAAMVFDDFRFKCYSRIWINHSCMLNLYTICKYIVSQLALAAEEETSWGNGSDEEMKHIKDRLQELLNGKKVLIVLHNLQGYDESLWMGLKEMLSVGGMGSTQVIVIATVELSEQDVVGVETLGIQPYCLGPLSEEMCCKIIKQAAAESAVKEDLEQIAPKLAKLCEGQPLAARLFGSVLQFKQYAQWPELQDFESFVSGPLQLTNRSLPPNLMLCLAYCVFVLDMERDMVKDDLIHQWIALDLIEPSELCSAPQLAEQYLTTFLDMSLLQTAKSSRTSVKDDTCAISFIIHREVRRLLAYFICDSLGEVQKWRTGCFTENHYYALVFDCDIMPSECIPHQNTRALCCLDCSKLKRVNDWFLFPRHLRVLELHKSSMQKLPESICELRHLGYLKLSGWSGLVTLPDSIGDLKNLLHIDLSVCYKLKNLPESFGKLINLLYINLSGCSALENLPESFGKLIKLVHINLSGCSALENLPDSFRKLTKLVNINLTGSSALLHLPKKFGKLINLVHINLSGSSALVQLPEFFGKLINLVHINLSGSHALANLPESFDKLKKLEDINLSSCPKLAKLPASFGKLTNLVHIDLSGCPGLVNLPVSFGKLTNLAHINLSGCSGLLGLRQSFGKLISLVHINLSGCSGLVTLPGSFGDLQNLLHVDLSHCYGLSKLPESFGKLKKLVHLDLSFCSCFDGIQTALNGLTNLQHLNLSHPCCCRADYPHLHRLKKVLGQFTRLKHLNLSMFTNPIFCNQSEKKNHKYIADISDLISSFSRLEHLDLSHNIFLRDVPISLARLKRLHTLDLSGCIRFKKASVWMTAMSSLKSVVLTDTESYQFVVGTDNVINNYSQLVDVRCKELEITCLNNMKSVEEAQRIRLAEKHNLQKLKLCWSVGSQGTVEDNVLLGELVPPHSLVYLELHGYRSTCFPSWLTPSRISCGLRSLTMKNCNNLVCSPEIVGALSSLETLCFSDCDWMTVLPEPLGGLSSLRELQIMFCHKFQGLPDSMKQHTSLQSLYFSACNGMEELPSWLGNLTCLRKLTIEKCTSIGSLPPSISELTNLKVLHILGCPRLEQWCREEDGKNILGHILPKFEETPTSEQRQQLQEIEEDDSEQSDSEQLGQEQLGSESD